MNNKSPIISNSRIPADIAATSFAYTMKTQLLSIEPNSDPIKRIPVIDSIESKAKINNIVRWEASIVVLKIPTILQNVIPTQDVCTTTVCINGGIFNVVIPPFRSISDKICARCVQVIEGII